MYNFIWNITKEYNAANSSTEYLAEINPGLSDPIFNGFETRYVFEDKDIEVIEEEGSEDYDKAVREWIENELIEITANYLSLIDPYNKLNESTNINFNYINHEEKL